VLFSLDPKLRVWTIFGPVTSIFDYMGGAQNNCIRLETDKTRNIDVCLNPQSRRYPGKFLAIHNQKGRGFVSSSDDGKSFRRLWLNRGTGTSQIECAFLFTSLRAPRFSPRARPLPRPYSALTWSWADRQWFCRIPL